MAAPFYKNPVYLIALAVGVGAIFVLTSPEEPVKKVSVPKTGQLVAKKQVTDLIPADYTTKFPATTATPANVFKPLVAKQGPGTGSGSGAPSAPGGIPAALAAGEGTWVYSGMAVVDGVPTGLVENQTTSDSVFLKRGERWKTCSVIDIKPDQIVLVGPNSTRVVVRVRDDSKSSGPTAVAAAPVTPLVGDIGTNPMAIAPDTGATGGNGGNGRGRGRGRRNGANNGNGDGN